MVTSSSRPLSNSLTSSGDSKRVKIVSMLQASFRGDPVHGTRVKVAAATRTTLGHASPRRLLAHWGARHTLLADTPRHAACGTPIEARWYCPTCDHLVEDEPEIEMHVL